MGPRHRHPGRVVPEGGRHDEPAKTDVLAFTAFPKADWQITR